VQKRICVIGAGPAGLSFAKTISNSKDNIKVDIVELGRNLPSRICPVDLNKKCNGCNGVCNVISGLGGSIHFGDSIKLSGFPAGRRLKTLLGEDYRALEEQALGFFGCSSTRFLIPESDKFEDQNIRPYPVLEVSQEFLASRLIKIRSDLTNKCALYSRTKVHSVEKLNKGFRVFKSRGTEKYYKDYEIVVFATGRAGFSSTTKMLEGLGVRSAPPKISIGIRLELPAQFLRPMYKAHADFKFTTTYEGRKVKSFCFSSNDLWGGRLKFCHYQDQFAFPVVFLDGHSTVSDNLTASQNGAMGNFALLAQLDSAKNISWLSEDFVSRYHEVYDGKPIFESLSTFLEIDNVDQNSVLPSIADISVGKISELIPTIEHRILKSACFDVLRRIAATSKVDFNEVINSGIVLAPEVEFFWPTVDITECFQSNIAGIYALGDAAGVAQGNLQAAISGIACANSILESI